MRRNPRQPDLNQDNQMESCSTVTDYKLMPGMHIHIVSTCEPQSATSNASFACRKIVNAGSTKLNPAIVIGKCEVDREATAQLVEI